MTKVPRYFNSVCADPIARSDDTVMSLLGNIELDVNPVFYVYINVAQIFLLPETNYIIILPRSIIFALRGLPHSIPSNP